MHKNPECENACKYRLLMRCGYTYTGDTAPCLCVFYKIIKTTIKLKEQDMCM